MSFERDYFIMKVSASGAEVLRAPASYQDMCRMTRAVLEHLARPVREVAAGSQEVVISTGEPLLPHEASGFWTEHGDRTVVNALAAELGYSKDERDKLGRWVPEQSDDYLRSARFT
eukprot:1632116-Karenia_brevis.AAC.1